MKSSVAVVCFTFLCLLLLGTSFLRPDPLGAQQVDYDTLKAHAERLYAEGSFTLARNEYLKVVGLPLPRAAQRWVDYRLADTLWRAEAASETSDTTVFERAQHQLEVLVRDIKRDEDKDRVWAEVQQSLGDFWWTRRECENWDNAGTYYQAALDWWAGAQDMELARQHYLGILWGMTKPRADQHNDYDSYIYWNLPLDVLNNALKIAVTPTDKAHAHFLMAMVLRSQGGDWHLQQRIPIEFKAALAGGKSTEWYDDALFYYADWLNITGPFVAYTEPLQPGQRHPAIGWRQQPDPVKAVAVYRRLLAELKKGESRYRAQAAELVKKITSPSLSVSTSYTFLPHSETQYNLCWRNVKQINFTLYKIDIGADLRFPDKGYTSPEQWIQHLNYANHASVMAWRKKVVNKGDYRPGQAVEHLKKLPVGAYLLAADAGAAHAREIVLVTDTTLVMKTSAKQALVYCCDAFAGAPVAGARVKLWTNVYVNGNWHWQSVTAQTNKDGISIITLKERQQSTQFFAVVERNNRQAFCVTSRYTDSEDAARWRIFAFTDRPVYRPEDEVKWKFIARQYANASYATPANQTIRYEIYNPRGEKVQGDDVKLNAFGSAWGTLPLRTSMPLGEYKVRFLKNKRDEVIGEATLFRLEEYKLPEFKVSVSTPMANGRRKLFRTGDKVKATIKAEYYFGGPVANAVVEVIVHQTPYYHTYRPEREYPWLYEESSRPSWESDDSGQEIKHAKVKTDAKGEAVFTFQTPANTRQDFAYRIEVRVTDASRREIVASDVVHVTRQSYNVYANPAHFIYRPRDIVRVEIKALDANDHPVQVNGNAIVTRDTWDEMWENPAGKKARGAALQRLQTTCAPDGRSLLEAGGWYLTYSGYTHTRVSSNPLQTNAEGNAEVAFTPARDGYYHVYWKSKDSDGAPVQAESAVWVSGTATTQGYLGKQQSNLEIITDKDTFRAGQTARVMLTSRTSGRYVLFCVEGDDLYHYQLVHLTGSAGLIELPITARYMPNVFLNAAMVSNRQMFNDAKKVVVPAEKQSLTVEVKPDKAVYQPRETGAFTVTTRNSDGKPVSAEVALGLADASVYALQQDYAGDPRYYYFGASRGDGVESICSLNLKQYAVLGAVTPHRKMPRMSGRLVYRHASDLMVFDSPVTAPAMQSRVYYQFHADSSANLSSVSLAASPNAESSIIPGVIIGAADGAYEINRRSAQQPSEPSPDHGPAVIVRSDFRSTVFWQPDVVTGADGKATVKVKYPDALTGWKATARAATAGSQFGIAEGSTQTKQPLIVRLQGPRFFCVGDQPVVSAVINNNTGKAVEVMPSINTDGLVVTGLYENGQMVKGEIHSLTVPANGEARVDWVVYAQKPGEAVINVEAKGTTCADAMEKRFPIYEHGVEKYVGKAGKLRGDGVTVKVDLPSERKPESTTLTVQVSPSLAVTMLDALPYLINYPYGCTEQTMSRFLPSIITMKTLNELGLSPEAAAATMFGGIEAGSAQARGEKKQDMRKLDAMVAQGLGRLYDFQHSDGGWGWWKQGESDHYMTAYVVWGLSLAGQAGVQIHQDVLERGANYLDKTLAEEEGNYCQQAWMLHALSVFHAIAKPDKVPANQATAFENLWKNRTALNAYSRALLAISAHNYGYTDRAKTLVQNLVDGVTKDTTPDISVIMEGEQHSDAATLPTAHWGSDGFYWEWSEGGVETTSFVLQSLLAIDPQNALVEPAMNWLVKNRRGAQWSNTRDTAIAVLTLNDYLRTSGELQPDMTYEVLVNGHSIATTHLNADNALAVPSQYVIGRQFLADGSNQIQIKRIAGHGALYFDVDARYFSLEEPIPPGGRAIFVRRQYYRLLNRPTLLKGTVFEKRLLADGETVNSGDRLEVVMTIDAKNDYDYLLFEDLKPAGLEAVQLLSGDSLSARELKSSGVEYKFGANPTPSPEVGMRNLENLDYTDRTASVYQELRDRNVAMFITHLPQGVWEIRYIMRAEVPGNFHALPVLGHAMYTPEVRCNGAEMRLSVEDKPIRVDKK